MGYDGAMHPETTPDAPLLPRHPADSIVPESDAPAPRPWCPDGPHAEVVALGDRIAELSARIHAATWELLSLIRQFDERNAGRLPSCAEWLGWRTGLEPGAAREHVRALADLPKLRRRDAARQGLLLEDARGHAGGTPETEDDLLNVALSGLAAHVEKIVRAWRRVRTAWRSRPRTDGGTRPGRCGRGWTSMVVVRGRLSRWRGPAAGAAACDKARHRPTRGAERGAEAEASWRSGRRMWA